MLLASFYAASASEQQLPRPWGDTYRPKFSDNTKLIEGKPNVIGKILELYRKIPAVDSHHELELLEVFVLPPDSSLTHYIFEINGVTDIWVGFVVDESGVIVDNYSWGAFD